MKKWMLVGMLLMGSMNLFAQQIAEMEYFFDTDPGVGNGTSVTVSSADTVNTTFNISTTSLSVGFHRLYIRAKDINGIWSLYSGGSFYVNPASSQTAPPAMTELEYFVDSDPGVDNATSIPLGPADTVDLTQTLLLAGLAPGPHLLSMRAKDAQGIWGLYRNQVFWVTDSTSKKEAPGMVQSELFYDSDPGVGNGFGLVSGPQDTMDYIETFPTTGLSPGFHSLQVRNMDAEQHWGLYLTAIFYVEDSLRKLDAPSLVGLEYFYGMDPGVGNGTYMALPPKDTVDDWFQFPTAGLGIGTHRLSVRVVDEDGNWSFISGETFQIQSGCGITPVVSPGGPLSFCSGDSVQLSTNSSYASYLWTNGDTTSSIWVSQSGSYSVLAVDSAGCSGNSFPITVDVGAPIDGFIIPDAEVLCEFSSMNISVSQPYSSYLWSTGETSSTISVNTGGSYSVTVTNADGCSKTLDAVMITEEAQPPQPDVVQIAPDSLQSSLIGPSYRWWKDFVQLTETSRTIHATKTGEYQVAIISTNGCQSDKADPVLFTATALEDLIDLESLSIYPNPNAGSFTLRWESLASQNIHISVINAMGQHVYDLAHDIGTGIQEHKINITGHATGLYILSLTTPEGQINRRIILK